MNTCIICGSNDHQCDLLSTSKIYSIPPHLIVELSKKLYWIDHQNGNDEYSCEYKPIYYEGVELLEIINKFAYDHNLFLLCVPLDN